MAMGRMNEEQQQALWVDYGQLPEPPGHAYYDALNRVLAEHGFNQFVEELCADYYADVMGRPSVPPPVYFRLLFIGYFEGIDSERGIAWRAADSLTLRRFLGYELTDNPPDHSSLSRTRRLFSLETHQEVFQWVVTTLALEGQVKGKTLGIDATTLEANAALRSIVRRDSGERYQEFLERLAKASGIETPTREDLAKFDKNRPRKGSNKEWMHPHDSDARITKMKDGRTHLAHKAEHAVDMQTGAIVGVTLQGADQGDTKTVQATLGHARQTLDTAAEESEAAAQMHAQPASEVVTDKGYHSVAVLTSLGGARSYFSEPKRKRRNWKGKPPEQQKALYANRRRIQSNRGKALLRRRGELVERSFAHSYDTGGMRRCYLRHHKNIHKRQLIHIGAFNLGVLMRNLLGEGTPKQLAETLKAKANALKNAALSLPRLLVHRCTPRIRAYLHNFWSSFRAASTTHHRASGPLPA